jgi:hypothetical protein
MDNGDVRNLSPMEFETKGAAARRYEPPQIVDYGTVEERTEIAPSPSFDGDSYS